ncbi:hypothetical protein BH10PAT1_BH10PAT1_6340 [soil metagenome]
MPTPENPITTRPDAPIVSESLQQAGISVTPTQVTQVNDNQGKPMMTTPATVGAKIQIPSDRPTLLKKAQGSVNDAATWLANFWLRIIKKQNANNNNH